MTDDPDEVDDLYALPREEFTAARNQLARAARKAGEKERAAEVEKLAKPTTAAWLVNRLVRQRPDALRSLLDLGQDLRAAHSAGAGEDLRALTRRRTELLRELVDAAADGEQLSEPVTRELEEMFTAAITDEDAAARLAAGRVTTVKDLHVTQVWPGLAVAPATRPAQSRADKAAAPKKPRADAALVKQARAAVKEAESTRADADRAVTDAESAIEAAEQRVRELNALLDEAESAELESRRALQVARREAKAAERAAGQAWRRLRQVEGTDAGE
ncbi:hypothetical protein [Actinokineospora bangkokensis]|uniref:Uncharacterized protein n=1 Tax=Actinokineospora bangkokensis TaxID=1193682 RepID=A0A1Q9LQ93_9PSEU|nr:hypothetical protein [Actinokineospora bangkokensis]OLR94171.1 hypothetical protein BJP25_10225 [Actinokineospora bangkokensis]